MKLEIKKIIGILLLLQSGFIIAQTETVVTPYGKKVTVYTNPLLTADNGLTVTARNVQLGGSLTKASVLTTTSAFTLALKGLQTGLATDNIIVTDANDVLKIVNPNILATEPWYNVATNTQATLNTQNIYQMGKVAIGKTTVQTGAALDVKGAIRVGTTAYIRAVGANSLAVGDDLTVSGSNSVAIGTGDGNCDVSGNNSIAIGRNLTVSGNNSIAVGYADFGDTTISSKNAIAVGASLKVSGDNSVVFNLRNTTKSANTFVMGVNNNIGTIVPNCLGSALFGSNNNLGSTGSGAISDMGNSAVFGSNNQIKSSGGVLDMRGNTIFGNLNTIDALSYNGDYGAFSNNAVFGTSNTISAVTSATAAQNTTVFGEGNNASTRNQFVLGNYNLNAPFAIFEIGVGTASARNNAVTVLNNGNVGINNAAPVGYKLYVNGQAGGATAWASASDRRFKKDITPITGALDKIMKIQGVGYNWRIEEFKDKNFNNRHQLGVIAQDVEQVVPESVSKDDQGYYAVAYTTLIPVLVEAVKEQQSQMDELKKAIVKQLEKK